MATEAPPNQELASLLKVDGNGYELDLFKDRDQLRQNLCNRCHAVCCDPVELGCDHDDEQIFIYCSGWLSQLIDESGQKCPINGHPNPEVFASRSIRRQIAKATVLCPYSIEFKQRVRVQQAELGNAHVVDTLGDDEKE